MLRRTVRSVAIGTFHPLDVKFPARGFLARALVLPFFCI